MGLGTYEISSIEQNKYDAIIVLYIMECLFPDEIMTLYEVKTSLNIKHPDMYTIIVGDLGMVSLHEIMYMIIPHALFDGPQKYPIEELIAARNRSSFDSPLSLISEMSSRSIIAHMSAASILLGEFELMHPTLKKKR